MIFTATVDPGTTSTTLVELLQAAGYNFATPSPLIPLVAELVLQWVDGTIHVTAFDGVAVATVASTNGGFQLDTTTRFFKLRQPGNKISLHDIALAGAGATDTVKIFAYQD